MVPEILSASFSFCRSFLGWNLRIASVEAGNFGMGNQEALVGTKRLQQEQTQTITTYSLSWPNPSLFSHGTGSL